MAAIQLLYWGLWFQRIAWYKKPQPITDASLPAVSIVICARNEAANLQKNLESILTQDYPIYEVVVVNDDSEDATFEKLTQYRQQYAHLQVVSVKEKKGKGKKTALTQGILNTKYDWLLLTDADCQPNSKHWIQKMVQIAVATQKDIVLGYGPYIPEKTWLSRWVQFETIYVAIQYLSFALWKMPYMGVGRNLLYKKQLFEKNQGFSKHEHLISGDDDLFVNEVATGSNTAICIHPDAFMYSQSPKSWQALYRQKTRHYSSSSHYKIGHKILLGGLSLSHLCFYLGLCIFISTNVWNYGIIVIIILRTFLLQIVFAKYLNKTKNIQMLLYVGVLDIVLPIYYLIFASSVLGKNNNTWK